MARLTLDYTNMLAPRLDGRGVPPEALDGLRDRFAAIHADVERRRESGELGFYALPYAAESAKDILEFAEGPGQVAQDIVVLGIGGSALGTIALRDALLPFGWNALSLDAREGFPRLHVLDNVDPDRVGPVLDRIEPGSTLYIVVSKSGTTAETMAQFMVARQRLLDRFDEEGARRHVVFVTDPESGVLRDHAHQALAVMSVPGNVGGRFSVLSPVGLLPAALVGIEIRELLAGARSMDERCRTDALHENPAALFAALQWLADTEAGAPIHVMMAYSDRLYGLADWYRQLWAESLGKREALDGTEVFAGPTPVKALGATDQHSQVQLYMEGPLDKTVTFLTVGERDEDVAIPELYGDVGALGYLGGRTLGELLDAEQQATAGALAEAGRMNMTIQLPSLSARGVGELIMMLEIATVYAGALYGIDPLNQPGVELGKKLTYGLMGRPGFEGVSLPEPDPDRVSR